jgi:DNA-binding transcriptional regulator YhcF (GntR family)
MALKPVQKILISDGILEQIRDLIHSSEFSPGQKLPSKIQMADQAPPARKIMSAHFADIEKEFLKILYRPGASA